MIGYLQGLLTFKREDAIILLVSNIGYEVRVLPDIFLQPEGAELQLHIHHVVREDAQDLYGFSNEAQLKMFKILISVSGIGPKTALGILSVTTVERLQQAVVSNDIKLLTTFSGIGRKTAERLLVELKDKIGKLALTAEGHASSVEDLEVLSALEQFGYSSHEVRRVVADLPQDIVGLEARLRAALNLLSAN